MKMTFFLYSFLVGRTNYHILETSSSLRRTKIILFHYLKLIFRLGIILISNLNLFFFSIENNEHINN